jgi:hypothetical protein
MVSKLIFSLSRKNNPNPPRKLFDCSLQCQQCEATSRNGNPCQKKVCIGLPFCYHHLRSTMRLTIRDTPPHGKGLFCWAPNVPDVVFTRGDLICLFGGENLVTAEHNYRYTRPIKGRPRTTTAPYSVKRPRKCLDAGGTNRLCYYDGACQRHFSQLANMGNADADNNAELVGYTTPADNPNNVIQLIATRDIHHNDEILVNYTQPDLQVHLNYHFHDHQHTTKRKNVQLDPATNRYFNRYA